MNPVLPVIWLLSAAPALCQLTNRAPHFVPVTGDFSKFSLKENTQVGTPVYQLRGVDPESSALHYSISGQQFTVDRNTGVVTLRQPLDRETQDLVEVIISITDEGIAGSEPNTVSLRREIAILDENDNTPEFHNRPYSANVSESSPLGAHLLVSNDIVITDKDGGVNSDVTVSCFVEPSMRHVDDVCDTFNVVTEKITEGSFKARITLRKQLDFETRSTYILTLKATDGASRPLSAFASVAIDIIDVQDQPPVFLNSPYSATVPENTAQGTSIMKIKARDGDTGDPRPVLLTVEEDELGYFELQTNTHNGEGVLVTSKNPLDRENEYLLQNGGIYTFLVKATELINDEVPAESTTSQITIVVTDIDDKIPRFNKDSFEIYVSEDISTDTHLPGLTMTITDDDLGANSRYNISLVNVQNSDGVFGVFPTHGEGRTPVVIKVLDTTKLDYDVEDTSKRTLVFDVIASVRNRDMTKSRVTVHVLDANDHSPRFQMGSYRFNVPENAVVGHHIADIAASDEDSGDFGVLAYTLRGFGAETFSTDPEKAGLRVAKKLDYETQKSYSLTLEAKDGGGKVTTVNVLIDVDDVNDNHPIFESAEYHRIIRDGAMSFDPQFFVHAYDVDGPDQGGGKIFYTIESTNSISDTENNYVFSVDGYTGEIRIEKPVNSMDTPRGQYELTVKATDAGVPPLSNETRVIIRVGIAGNQRPVFKGNYNNIQNMLAGPASYRATVKENAVPGTLVATVIANDPDGIDSLINYYIAGGDKDNFLIDNKSGEITVSPDSNLDLDSGFDHYDITVHAVDSGTPVPETATTTVYIMIEDVNNKPPAFAIQNSTAYITERAEINDKVIQIHATDPDKTSKISYSITEPIRAVDKTGLSLKSTNAYNYKNAFKINQDGEILVNHTLDYQTAAVVTLTVMARDLNAEVDAEKQIAKTEVTVYVQAYSDDNPVFLNDGWSFSSPNIKVTIEEEKPIGTKILTLMAKDPLNDLPIGKFNVIHTDTDVLTMVPNGEIILTKRLDYEGLDNKKLSFNVEAISDDNRKSTANILIEVIDLNDNSPNFEKSTYRINVLESVRHPYKILSVHATDLDSASSREEQDRGFGLVRYSLVGENSNYFTINSTTGDIQVAPNVTIDKEKQSVLKFVAIATDTPNGGPLARKSSAEVIVDVLDVNDNAPKFQSKAFTAVVPENVNVRTSVVNLTAYDPDEGIGGDVKYEIVDEGESNGLFQINQISGEIKTKDFLTGKGRTEPYHLTIRAIDGGGLFTDVSLTLYIGDVSANDGVPLFIKPTVDQIAHISENSTVGSAVFQVIASDPDDPSLPSGRLTYKLLDDGTDYQSFKIDPSSGLITTRKLLDREKKDKYTLVVVVADKGDPPQQASRILTIQVTDVDDHKPHFERGLDDLPVVHTIEEEIELGSIIGEIKAIDEDINENGAIDYMITYGNELDLFSIERTDNNTGIIRNIGRLDREEYNQHLLTVKCFKPSSRNVQLTRKPFNRLDPSETQLLIKLKDIDDNVPTFTKTNATIGIRLNVPIDTSLLTIEAKDIDEDAEQINYEITNSTFKPLVDFGETENATNVFRINSMSGELRTARSLVNFVDGVFRLNISANNSNMRSSYMIIQVYIVRDRDLLKFVFSKPPAEVQKMLSEFENAIQEALSAPDIEVHVYDTQFYAKHDNSLDFSSTSSCFQLVGKESMTTKDMMNLLEDETIADKLQQVYHKYHVTNIDKCSIRNVAKAETTLIQLWVLVIACFIGVGALIAICTVCCMHCKYKRKTRRLLMHENMPPMSPVSYLSAGPPRVYAEPLYST